MIRRAYILGLTAVLLAAAAIHTAPSYGCKLFSSAASFQQYCRDLKVAGSSLNAIERVVFSLVLANSKPQPERQAPVTSPRT
jgi:hypothetical protein